MISVAPSHAYEFPPYEGVLLKIEGKVTENYSNNITYAQDEENKIEQYTTMMTFGLDVGYEGKKRALRFGGQVRQPIRFDDSDVRNSSEMMTLDFNNEFSKHDRIRINDVYTHTRVPERFNQIDFLEECVKIFREFGFDVARDDPRCSEFGREFGVNQGAFDTYRNDFNFYYSRSISDQIDVTVGYRNNQYDSSEENSNDSVRNEVNGRVNYKISEPTTFFLSYRYSDTSYDRGGNISTDSVQVGIRQYITKRLYFSGGIGMDFTPSSDETSYDAVLTAEIDEKTRVTIDFSRDIRTAVDREDVFRNWRVAGRVNRLLMDDMDVFLSAFYGEGDFVSAEVTDTLLGASVSLNYIFWQHKRGARINGNLGYTYSSLDSTDENRGYNRSSVDATLSVAF